MSDEKIKDLEIRQTRLERGTNAAIEKMAASISNLVTEIKVSEQERRHDEAEKKRLWSSIEALQANDRAIVESIQSIKESQAASKPWLDLIQSINARIWFSLVGVMFTMITTIAGMAYMLSKAA